MNDPSQPLNVGMGGLLMGFGALISYLDAKGVIDKNEFASILEGNAGMFDERLGSELKELAAALREPERERPTLTSIEGGKSESQPS